MKKSFIKLPVDYNDSPNWEFMERYIKSLHHKSITTTVTKNKHLQLNPNEWGEFRIGQFFTVKRGSRIVRNKDYFTFQTNDYCYNVITSTKLNNGVDGYYHSFNCPKNSIVCCGEAGGMFTTYQPTECWVMDRARTFKPKKDVPINKNIGLFLATIFNQNQYKYSYGRTPNPQGIEQTIIKLPVNKEKSPDWAYMESYIKSLPYSDRI
ncbi:MAG: restriction endonuclease subunit S [Oscillospiraceae bacterium]|nr:restriction endonuclease subunit S [Oscillospiraceae bacterium]